jgi:hypothetical protein
MNILDEANSVIKERHKTHGDYEAVHRIVAKLWTVYVDHRDIAQHGYDLEAHDVAMMMALLKIGRIIATINPSNDSFIDTAGYISLAHKLASGTSNDQLGSTEGQSND